MNKLICSMTIMLASSLSYSGFDSLYLTSSGGSNKSCQLKQTNAASKDPVIYNGSGIPESCEVEILNSDFKYKYCVLSGFRVSQGTLSNSFSCNVNPINDSWLFSGYIRNSSNSELSQNITCNFLCELK